MSDASPSRSVVPDRRLPARAARWPCAARAIACVVAAAILAAGCGLKGALALPEKSRNVVIRPGPGGEPPPATEPAPEPLPPPELPPDTRGNTRD
jgi:hypothetical protein